MSIEELNEKFASPGMLEFDEPDGLVRAQVRLASAEATISLHGAHVTHWQPAGEEAALFLSERSEFAAGKPIRGGVPICFPWFGPRSDGQPGPSHGFARLQEWELAFAALIPGQSGDRLHLTFTLGPSELSRSLGFSAFRAAYEVIVGRTLTLRLSVANTGETPMHFEEALHAYFAVGDVRDSALTGLEGAAYLDKTDGLKEKTAPEGPWVLTEQTDRVFAGQSGAVSIHDSAHERVIRVEKSHSRTTVVWNPWSDGVAKIPDLAPDAWSGFVCVEAANTGTETVVLNAGETHTMQVVVSIAAA